LRVHSDREIAVTLATVDVRVRRRGHDPIRTRWLDRRENLAGITDVGVFRAEANDLVPLPLTKQRFAK
jgi:hypothetical protein